MFSIAIFLFFWDSTTNKLNEQGLIAVVINLVILAAMMVFGWF